jgi:hypothetical protein
LEEQIEKIMNPFISMVSSLREAQGKSSRRLYESGPEELVREAKEGVELLLRE